jgi:hypothetical protein
MGQDFSDDGVVCGIGYPVAKTCRTRIGSAIVARSM